jgi:cytochrome b
MTSNDTPANGQRIRIWDIWVRLFHWSLVVAVVFLIISGTTGWQFFEWHRSAGEFVLALLLFRICWGVVGSSNAKLVSLLSNPLRSLAHLGHLAKGHPAPERGHNAAGGWAVLIMLALLTFQALSGLFIADEDELLEGAFYGALSSDISDQLLYLHHLNGDILKVVLGVHILMIALYAIRASQNLVTPMISGWMKWPANLQPPEVFFQRWWIGLLLAAASAAGAGWLLAWW